MDIQLYEAALKSAFENMGLAGIHDYITKQHDKWTEIPVHIGVIGRCKVGKSSFINTVRSLGAEDDGAAETGADETTKKVTEYHHPDNKKLSIYDLPGLGTTSFKRETYLKDIEFEKYDIFILMTADAIMEDDEWLANAINAKGRALVFVRSKIGQDLDNLKAQKPKYWSRNPKAGEWLVASLKEKYEQKLKDLKLKKHENIAVYFIDSYQKDNPLLDFDKLIARMLNDFPKIKRDTFVLTIISLAPEMTANKKRILESRIKWTSLWAATKVAGAVLLPKTSISLNIGVILDEVLFYRKQFGLERERLEEIVRPVGKSMEELESEAELNTLALTYTREGLLQFATDIKESEKTDSYYIRFLPFVSLIVGGTNAYKRTESTLKTILDMMHGDAIKVYNFVQSMAPA